MLLVSRAGGPSSWFGKLHVYIHVYVNKPTIIREDFISLINWVQLVHGDKTISTPVFLWQLCSRYWSVARNFRDNEVLANKGKISHTRKNVGLQYFANYFRNHVFGEHLSAIFEWRQPLIMHVRCYSLLIRY